MSVDPMQEAFRGLSWIVPRSVLKLSSVLERRNLIGRRRSLQGILIQLLRLIGTPFTRFAVPFFGVTGHPGTSERAMGTHWPIDEELKRLLDEQLRPAAPFGLRIPPQ